MIVNAVFLRRPARPASLPCAGNRPRIAAQHTGVQLADVNTQLQRVGGDYGANLAFAQAALNLPPQRRQIAAPIAPDAPALPNGLDPFLEVPRQHLNRQPRFSENDGRNIVIHQHGRDVQRLLQNGFADAELLVDHRRVIEDDMLFSLAAPLWSITSTGRPISVEASSPGLAMVAEQQINCGFEP